RGLVVLDGAETPRLELAQQQRGAVVGAGGERDGRTRAAEGKQDGGRGAHAGGEEERIAALERAERRFGGGAAGMAVAGVVELAGVAARVVRPDRRAVRLHPANVVAPAGCGPGRRPAGASAAARGRSRRHGVRARTPTLGGAARRPRGRRYRAAGVRTVLRACQLSNFVSTPLRERTPGARTAAARTAAGASHAGRADTAFASIRIQLDGRPTSCAARRMRRARPARACVGAGFGRRTSQ